MKSPSSNLVDRILEKVQRQEAWKQRITKPLKLSRFPVRIAVGLLSMFCILLVFKIASPKNESQLILASTFLLLLVFSLIGLLFLRKLDCQKCNRPLK